MKRYKLISLVVPPDEAGEYIAVIRRKASWWAQLLGKRSETEVLVYRNEGRTWRSYPDRRRCGRGLGRILADLRAEAHTRGRLRALLYHPAA